VPLGAPGRAAIRCLVSGDDQPGTGQDGDQAATGPQRGQPASGDRRDRHHGHDPVIAAWQRAGRIADRHVRVQADAGQAFGSGLDLVVIDIDARHVVVSEAARQQRASVARPGADMQEI
jgi:diadenosine tetraphosphatase ApaH/serine/threonine PP2A family protein phosphatase